MPPLPMVELVSVPLCIVAFRIAVCVAVEVEQNQRLRFTAVWWKRSQNAVDLDHTAAIEQHLVATAFLPVIARGRDWHPPKMKQLVRPLASK